MRRRTDRVLYIMLILMGLITVLAMMFAGVLGIMYVKEKGKNQEAAVKQAQLEEEVVAAFAGDNNALNDEEVQQLVDAKEVEMKAKMKELVQSEDGGAMTMLRYFFPENLVYYDEGGYVFAPILDTLKKHQLVDENFHINDRNEIEYIENGIVTSHKGIDVSKYQGDINWQAVKADGVEYAFVRLGIRGYGSGKIVLDENFADNMQGANEAGVKAGVYFFTQAVTVEEAQEEAAFVIENLAAYDVPYPVVFDVEMITGQDGRANNLTMQERTDITIAFCEAVKAAGYTPMIYGNVKCFTKMLDMTKLEQYEKWYAFYDKYMYFPYEVSMWQYSEKGTVDGIEGTVDMNIAYKQW